MKRSNCTMLVVLALALVGQAAAINPKLEDKASDKKFFGPPFPADYPDDKRPVPQKDILNKLKGPDQPYPALQSKDKFERDFVKDENSDTGAWEAQFEYDALRKKLAKEEADEKRAQDAANAKDGDVSKAQADADAAAKKAADAQKGVDDATKGEDAATKGQDDPLPPSDENLKKLKEKLAEAEAAYEKEKKDFAECQKQLDAVKATVENLKAQQATMEAQLNKDTKLYIEAKQQQQMRFNLKKQKQTELEAEKASKQQAAQDKLDAAKKAKAGVDEKLAKEKAEHEQAKKNLQKEHGELQKAKEDLQKASTKLQKLHGYKPAVEAKPAHSGATMAPAALSLLIALATQIL